MKHAVDTAGNATNDDVLQIFNPEKLCKTIANKYVKDLVVVLLFL